MVIMQVVPLNSADHVQMLQNVASDQSFHTLLTEISMQNTCTVKVKTLTRSP